MPSPRTSRLSGRHRQGRPVVQGVDASGPSVRPGRAARHDHPSARGFSPTGGARSHMTRCPSAFACIRWLVQSVARTLAYRCGRVNARRRGGDRGWRPTKQTAGPASVTPPRATPLATPVDLRRQRNASDAELASRLHPGYRDAIRRLPAGRAGPSRTAVPVRVGDSQAPLAPARPRGRDRPADGRPGQPRGPRALLRRLA